MVSDTDTPPRTIFWLNCSQKCSPNMHKGYICRRFVGLTFNPYTKRLTPHKVHITIGGSVIFDGCLAPCFMAVTKN